MTVTEQTTAQNSVQRTTSRDTGAPAWIDLSTRDIEGAKAFYAELFGWTFEDSGGEEFAHYQFILRDGEPIGGLMSTVGMTCPEGGQLPTEWVVYLTVTDIDAAARAVETTGGGVVVPAMPVGDAGSMGVAIDPAGAAIGLWQAGDFAGFEPSSRPGSPVWFEAMSQNLDAVTPFYRDVFGWQLHEMPGDWRYVTNGDPQVATAGIGDARGVVAEGTPSYWRVYLSTADLDGDIHRLRGLDGAVLDGPVDSPHGRVATVADPQGASFQLLQPPSA